MTYDAGKYIYLGHTDLADPLNGELYYLGLAMALKASGMTSERNFSCECRRFFGLHPDTHCDALCRGSGCMDSSWCREFRVYTRGAPEGR